MDANYGWRWVNLGCKSTIDRRGQFKINW